MTHSVSKFALVSSPKSIAASPLLPSSTSTLSYLDEYVTAADAGNFLARHIKGIDTNYLLTDLRRGRARRHAARVPYKTEGGRVYYRLRDLLPLIETNKRHEKAVGIVREETLDEPPVVLAGAVSDGHPVVSMAVGTRGFVLAADEAEELARAILVSVKEARKLAPAKTGGMLGFFKKAA